jgi:hypothetical protein
MEYRGGMNELPYPSDLTARYRSQAKGTDRLLGSAMARLSPVRAAVPQARAFRRRPL